MSLPTRLHVTYVNFSAVFLTAKGTYFCHPHRTTYWFPLWQWLHVCMYVWTMQTHFNTPKVLNTRLSCVFVSSQHDDCTVVSYAHRYTQTHQGVHCPDESLCFTFRKWKLTHTIHFQSLRVIIIITLYIPCTHLTSAFYSCLIFNAAHNKTWQQNDNRCGSRGDWLYETFMKDNVRLSKVTTSLYYLIFFFFFQWWQRNGPP